jgi:hypothetical protein
MSLTKRWSEADYMSRVLLAQVSRHVTGSLILDVRQYETRFYYQAPTPRLLGHILLAHGHLCVRRMRYSFLR